MSSISKALALALLLTTPLIHAKRTRTITDKDAEKTTHLKFKTYDRIHVELPRALVSKGNITAWVFNKAEGRATYLSQDKTSGNSRPGSAGADIFKFKINEPGYISLEFGHVLLDPSGKILSETLVPSTLSFSIQVTEAEKKKQAR